MSEECPRPDAQIATLRVYLRQRDRLIEYVRNVIIYSY